MEDNPRYCARVPLAGAQRSSADDIPESRRFFECRGGCGSNVSTNDLGFDAHVTDPKTVGILAFWRVGFEAQQ